MSKKLLKIKIQTKPVLKEGPSDVATLLLEFKKLSQWLIDTTPSAKKASKVFNAFADSARVLRKGADVATDTTKQALEQLGKLSSGIDDLLDNSETIFKQALNGTNPTLRSVDADNVIKGLEELSDTFKATMNNKNLSGPAKRQAKDLYIKTNKKLNRLKELRKTSRPYKTSARRAKLEGQTALQQLSSNKQALEQTASNVDELAEVLPPAAAVKAAGKEAADEIAPIVQKTGQQGAEEAMKKGSKWRKYLVAAGLLGAVTLMYKSMGFNIADADDKKPIPTPTPTPGGGGGSSSPGQLAVQVTGISDEKTAIAEVQSILTELGFSIGDKGLPGNVTPGKYNANIAAAEGPFMPQYNIIGIYGPRTKQAVKKFQEMFGLKDDGKVGTNTWSKMMEFAKSDKNKRWQGGKGYRSMVAQAIDLKEKGADKKKDTIPEPSKAEKVQAIRSIDALMRQLLDGNGWQRIINSYIEVQNILVTKLMNMMDASRVSDAFKQDLRRQVQKALPPIPEGTPEERLEHAESTMHSIPVKITAKTLNSIDSSIVGKDIVEIILTVLERNIKEMEAENKKLEESKKYDLDFSKWSKIF